MYFFKSSTNSPFKNILKYYPSKDMDNIALEMIRDGTISSLVNRLLLEFSKGHPIDYLSGSTQRDHEDLYIFRIARSDVSTCILKTISGNLDKFRKTFSLTPNTIASYFIGEGHCEAILYEYEAIADVNQFNSSRNLKSSKKILFKNGDSTHLNKGIHGLQIIEMENMSVLEFCSIEHNDIVWNFDVETKKMLYPSSADISGSRITLAMDTLKRLRTKGDSNTFRTLEDICMNSKYHYARWKALETLSEMGEKQDKIIEILNTLKNDPHTDVRKAAKKTLTDNGIV